MTVYYQLLLDTILSCAETLILFQMYRAFLRRNSRPNKYYYLGLFSYFVFQLVTYAGRWPRPTSASGSWALPCRIRTTTR